MRSHRFLPSLLLLFSCATAAPQPRDQPQALSLPPKLGAEVFYETLAIGGASFSPDESAILVHTDATGVFNVYAQPVDGSAPVALTASESDAAWAVSYFPNDERILFESDVGGNELDHLYVREVDGTTQDLTPGDKLKAGLLSWSRDREWFYVVSNERDPTLFDLYRYETDGYRRELFFENRKGWTVAGVSPNGRYVVLGKPRTNADSDLYLWDSQAPTSEPAHITPHQGLGLHDFATFTADSSKLYYRTDAHGEFFQAWTYDVATGEHQLAIAADWDVTFVSISENDTYRVSGVNEDGRTVVTVLDLTTGKELALPPLPPGEIKHLTIAKSEKRMAFYLNADTSPPNLYVWEIGAPHARRLTDALTAKIDTAWLVEAEVVRFESFDKREIPALLYRPKGATADNPAPGLVWVHGGPGGQSRHGYRSHLQHLVNHGYAVLAVNNRGSSGYGKTFYHLDDRNHGDSDLKDCIWGRRYLETLPWVDAGHIGIIGGSYGGYMVLAALTLHPTAFDAGIDIFGVSNWPRTLENVPPWWSAFREALYAELGDPAVDAERLRAFSPLTHASRIVKPLLVVQGANDPRVLKAESDDIVAAARKNGVPVEYVLFEDEGHGFVKKENRIEASDAYVRFLDTHLRRTGPEG